MSEKNLEEKISSMKKFRKIAGKIVGIYLLPAALMLGSAGLSSCGGYSGGESAGCSHAVGGMNGEMVDGCSSGLYCKCEDRELRNGSTVYSCSCVSESSSDDYNPGW